MLTEAAKPVLDVADAAALLGCEEDRVRADARKLGGLKFGRDWVFPAATFFKRLNEMAERSSSSESPPRPPATAVLQAVPKRAPPALPTVVEPRDLRRAARRSEAPSPETTSP